MHHFPLLPVQFPNVISQRGQRECYRALPSARVRARAHARSRVIIRATTRRGLSPHSSAHVEIKRRAASGDEAVAERRLAAVRRGARRIVTPRGISL